MTLRFNFSVDAIDILHARALINDTIHLSASLAVANRPTISATRSLGKHAGGLINATAIRLQDIEIGDDETAIFSYLIVNKHDGDSAFLTWLVNLAKLITETGAKAAGQKKSLAGIGAAIGAAIGTAAVPLGGSALSIFLPLFAKAFVILAPGYCDGPVAAAVHSISGAELRQAFAQKTDDHLGTESPVGCGHTSHYRVQWSANPILLGNGGRLMQSLYGMPPSPDSLEAVVLEIGGPNGKQLVHYSRRSDVWIRGPVISTTATASASVIQSSYGPPKHAGNFELLALEGTNVVHYVRDNATGTWARGPVVSAKATGPPSLIQGTYQGVSSAPGNLEAVILEGTELVHYWRDDSASSYCRIRWWR